MLTATVTDQQNLTADRTSMIDVKNEIVARTFIDSLPQMPVDISKWIRGQASVEYVVPKCTAKWNFVEEEGYTYMNISSLVSKRNLNDFKSINFIILLTYRSTFFFRNIYDELMH